MKRLSLLATVPLFCLLASDVNAGTWIETSRRVLSYGDREDSIYIIEYVDVSSISDLSGVRYVNTKDKRYKRFKPDKGYESSPDSATQISCSQGLINLYGTMPHVLKNGDEWWTKKQLAKGTRVLDPKSAKLIFKWSDVTTQSAYDAVRDNRLNGIFAVVCGVRPSKDNPKVKGTLS